MTFMFAFIFVSSCLSKPCKKCRWGKSWPGLFTPQQNRVIILIHYKIIRHTQHTLIDKLGRFSDKQGACVTVMCQRAKSTIQDKSILTINCKLNWIRAAV